MRLALIGLLLDVRTMNVTKAWPFADMGKAPGTQGKCSTIQYTMQCQPGQFQLEFTELERAGCAGTGSRGLLEHLTWKVEDRAERGELLRQEEEGQQRSPPPREPEAQMEMVQELIPLAKELMAQKPSAKLVRMYLLGGVLALFGAVLGLMEAVCGPFREATLAELGEPAPRDQGKPLEAAQACRALSNRLHAS
ncbi:hypothetical protein MG293_012838 [Ovis ammon polii]|nr:hypothetical protein MG293_012838 [Ovis ammon polii]